MPPLLIMTRESILMQCQSECLEALRSVANIRKPFEKVFMDAMKLFMAIPGRINFLQMGRYGKFSEQTYRNHFVNESFDGFSFNEHLVKEHLPGKRKAIAVNPSYIPKSGKKTPWLGYFWSGCAGEYKRGLEIMGIGVIDVGNRECMTLGSVQSPDTKTLDNMDKSLVDWYAGYLMNRREQIHRISNLVVADAFFSKSTFITPMCDSGFHIISRFRNDAVLVYPTAEKPTGRRGRPKLYDGPMDFSRLDTSRCTEHEPDKGKLYGLKAWSKALKRMASLAVWYPDEGRTDKWQLYFSTDQNQSTLDFLEYYRTRFQLEFCFRDSKQYAGITNCQSTDFRKLAFHFNASLTAVNIAKAACKRLGCVFGIQPDTTLIDKIFKELILFSARAA